MTVSHISIKYFLLVVVFLSLIGGNKVYAQCTEAKDSDMAKYKGLTETQDAQGCSQCAMLSLYLCSARYTVEMDDKRKVSALISACKRNIQNMGPPYCCPELVNREPEWGIMAGGTSTAKNDKIKGVSTNDINSSLPDTSPLSPSSQSTGKEQLNGLINTLANQIKANPNNPLDINEQWLESLAGLVVQQDIKDQLLLYANQLGSNTDLSFRQVYFDLSHALSLNPDLASNPEYNPTYQSLDVLFTRSQDIVKALQGGITGVDATTFLSDPQFMASLTQITGSESYAGAMAIGAGFVLQVIDYIKEQQKYKEDYTKISRLSARMVFPEVDQVLGGALIDAYVGKIYSEIGVIYRYDFPSGAALMVENGILKWYDQRKQSKKDLVIAEVSNDGSPVLTYPHNNLTSIEISEDESMFLIKNGYSMHQPCKTCLPEGQVILLDSKTGLAVKSFKLDNEFREMEIKNASEVHFWKFVNNHQIGQFKVSAATRKPERLQRTLEITNPKFTFNEKIVTQWGNAYNSFQIVTNEFLNLGLIYGTSQYVIGMASNAAFDVGSFLQITDNDGTRSNSSYFVNKLTGLVVNSHGVLFVTGVEGEVFKIDIAGISEPDEICKRIEAGLKERKYVAKYDLHERIEKERLFKPYASLKEYTFPKLTLTPDEKWLVYSIRDNIYFIDTQDITKARHFKLTHEVLDLYFAKENNSYTLVLLGANEYGFPVTKKYSINKLTELAFGSK